MNNEIIESLINVARPQGMTFLQEYELLCASQNVQDIIEPIGEEK